MKTQRRNSTSMNEATEGRREYPPMMRDLINHDVIPSVRESVSCIDLHNLLIEGRCGGGKVSKHAQEEIEPEPSLLKSSVGLSQDARAALTATGGVLETIEGKFDGFCLESKKPSTVVLYQKTTLKHKSKDWGIGREERFDRLSNAQNVALRCKSPLSSEKPTNGETKILSSSTPTSSNAYGDTDRGDVTDSQSP